MRDVISEYGLLVCSIIGGSMVFGIVTFMITHYKDFSKNLIGCITGAYVSYESELTLEDIERGMF